IERKRGKTTGCPVTNLAVELALADRDLRALLDDAFALWGNAIRKRLAGSARADALATTIVASFGGAMTLAKTSQSAQPLRSCAESISQLLKDA
ncbi:MAG TPA: hypothetical protein VFN49_11415, partial [Candidatus Aquilonibacter sp.]|nr:hypothetical protein [Candidatus Aquilonibacter sp.]